MLRTVLTTLAACWLAFGAAAQSLQDVLQDNAAAIAKPSRSTVDAVIADLAASGLPGVPDFLVAWRDKGVWQRDADGLFFYAAASGDDVALRDVDTGDDLGSEPKAGYTEIRPNAGVRRVIGTALVQFLLSDPDTARRRDAVESLARRPEPDQLEPLRASITVESDPALLARKTDLERQLTARFDPDPQARIAAIESLSGNLSVEARAVLNQILSTREAVAREVPADTNLASTLDPGTDISVEDAYQRLVDADLAPTTITRDARDAALVANIDAGRIAGIDVATLDTEEGRAGAYARLAEAGNADPFVPEEDRAAAAEAHTFYVAYDEADAAVTDAARASMREISTRLAFNQFADISLDALSLASIYFLAAIGLAITFGVMGVINMAHGEFIMMGAYTGYVIQQIIPDYTISIIVALPVAFAVTFGAGVALERLVIRWLYHRPLETLLATFGISIALQQLAKNVFGTQARPLTSPGWLDGAWVLNDVVSISYIRIAIFFLALIFLGLILFILRRTRLGLEVRAVTQNPGMAASMGINPDRINMLTFGLGSGIAGIAGVAIGLYAKVTSEMGGDYIVQSFMTVVVGGVGNVWGTLAGASLIGFTQKGIEWFNPSNTLAAQTYMILFVILFIQFRPKGIVALKGRAAGD
ncbi:urea ABC transporter permease subunit UrtB [Sulfitobacter sp. D35]|uniref:urea ABC transporter permease subunit UrtB n=1 Tax=Sulfitobacter sp. D35 TaxID=3083252 RepID=UPI00296E82C2|nr:urea ABC transporter permease subunit UrtB [Sulfitobacter sp. D35]MDW4497960.1 urea ABC transporter permease subunit UrtB [Sulfitobacter sp. D35]